MTTDREPTIAELGHQYLRYTAVAAGAKLLADHARQALEARARADYERDGAAPTYRIGGVGTVPLALSHDTVMVDDPRKYLDWVAERYPGEVEEIVQVRPAFDAELRRQAAKLGAESGAACTPDGEVIPGLRFVPGGEVRGVSVRPDPAARHAAESEAAAFLLNLPDGAA